MYLTGHDCTEYCLSRVRVHSLVSSWLQYGRTAARVTARQTVSHLGHYRAKQNKILIITILNCYKLGKLTPVLSEQFFCLLIICCAFERNNIQIHFPISSYFKIRKHFTPDLKPHPTIKINTMTPNKLLLDIQNTVNLWTSWLNEALYFVGIHSHCYLYEDDTCKMINLCCIKDTTFI